MDNYKYIIIGAGLFGLTIAERIANVLNKKVLIIDQRNHIGGNCYSEIDIDTGIEYHKYGPHIFHTSDIEVWNYINKFTEFNNYKHKVLANYEGKIYNLPINLHTINKVFNEEFTPLEAKKFISNLTQIYEVNNLEEYVVSKIGNELYTVLIKGYTKKQWHRDPKNLPADIIKRIPIRFTYDDNYYFDHLQGIPVNGYTEMFKKMLSNKNIDMLLNTNYKDIKQHISNSIVVYTGKIDEFFNYLYGKLDYIGLKFEKEIYDGDYQGISQMNFTSENVEYTRIVEPKHFILNKQFEKTIILKEFSLLNADPYYPINDENNKKTYNKYFELSKNLKNVFFGGRLGEYKYYDMDKTIRSALDLFNKIKSL